MKAFLKSKKVHNVGFSGVLFGVLAFAVYCKPSLLSENVFLNNFVNQEILQLLSVILTVTLASVANIHLSINRIIKESNPKNFSSAYKKSMPLRREVNSSAWLLLAFFVLNFIGVTVKGAFPFNHYIVAAAHAFAIFSIAMNVLVLFDMYRVVFKLVSTPNVSNSETKGEDYNA